MHSVIVKQPAHRKISFMQGILDNRLHKLASRTAITTSGRIEYWEAYIGYLKEHRSHMLLTGRQDIVSRCDSTIHTIEKRIMRLRKGFMAAVY